MIDLRSLPWMQAPSTLHLRHLRERWVVLPHDGRAAAATIEGVVLIVDNDAGFRAHVSHLLERANLPSVQTGRGEEALELAASSRPAAVLLDVSLPDIDGFEVCRELRDRFGDSLPVIFISGERIEAHDRTAGLLLGGDDYLIKPGEPGRASCPSSSGNRAHPRPE